MAAPWIAPAWRIGLSYYVLSLFPGTYPGILSAFFVIGLVLAFGIPSMTVRTAIMVPIAWALVKSLEIPLAAEDPPSLC